jgi:hypothetical protein
MIDVDEILLKHKKIKIMDILLAGAKRRNEIRLWWLAGLTQGCRETNRGFDSKLQVADCPRLLVNDSQPFSICQFG